MHADSSPVALVVVDVQQGLDSPTLGRRNNPACEGNIARLIDAWRAVRRPIVFVRHDSTRPGSPLRPGQPGNRFKPAVSGVPDLLVTKSVNSAFFGTPDLHAWLTDHDIRQIVVIGIQTNFCVEATARNGSDLGYDTTVVIDATHTFDLTTPDGEIITAEELARASAANIHHEFGTVVTTDRLLAQLATSAPGGTTTR